MGEPSKTSGEIGEKIANNLLEKIGWKLGLKNVSIDCNNPSHLGKNSKPRKSHGDDRIFIYNNPFHDDTTEIVHVSVKNNLNNYPPESKLKTLFKSYIEELQKTIDCAKYNQILNEMSQAHPSKKHKKHVGLLIWLQNDETDIETNIKPILSNIRLETSIKTPIYLIDNARASFLLNTTENIKQKYPDANIQFFYPPIGTSVHDQTINRSNTFLPVELIASDIIPFLVKINNRVELVLYADQKFSKDDYKKLISYALLFSNGLVSNIKIGMPDYNPTKHKHDAETARLFFSEREEDIIPFSFHQTILNLSEDI